MLSLKSVPERISVCVETVDGLGIASTSILVTLIEQDVSEMLKKIVPICSFSIVRTVDAGTILMTDMFIS